MNATHESERRKAIDRWLTEVKAAKESLDEVEQPVEEPTGAAVRQGHRWTVRTIGD